MGIALDKAELIAIFLETFLYGKLDSASFDLRDRRLTLLDRDILYLILGNIHCSQIRKTCTTKPSSFARLTRYDYIRYCGKHRFGEI